MPLSKETRNEIALFIASHRSLKKFCLRFLPPFALLKLEGWRLALDPRDMRGPSFHMAKGCRNPGISLSVYEPAQRSLINAAIAKAGEGAVFLDVGANIGLFSFPAARANPAAKVFGFEPYMRNAVCFAETVLENGFGNVTLVPAAVGERDGDCRLFIDESDAGGHTMLPENLWNNHARTESQMVPTIKLDTFAQVRSLGRIDVMKIDVQGGEDAVLRGGMSVLRQHLPDILIEAQHEKVIDDGALVNELAAISDRYRFRTMESADWRPIAELEKISAERFAEDILFADYFFSVKSE